MSVSQNMYYLALIRFDIFQYINRTAMYKSDSKSENSESKRSFLTVTSYPERGNFYKNGWIMVHYSMNANSERSNKVISKKIHDAKTSL